MDAREIVERAWAELPRADRALLESIRAHQWEVCDQPLGSYADVLLRSADRGRLSDAEVARANAALGIWIPQLRVVLVNSAHPALAGLDPRSYEWALTRVAWHEWGHALSIDRTSPEEVAAGGDYLDRLPPALAKLVRDAGYRRKEYTHEVVAEIYSILMIRRRLGETGKPPWLHREIYELVRRVAGWNQ
jgi:hypothetical protein